MKKISIFLIALAFIVTIIIKPDNKNYVVTEIKSPVEILINNTPYRLEGADCFDDTYSEHNKNLAEAVNISEEEGFIIGNLSKYWAENLLKGRKVKINKDGDLEFLKFNYRKKFLYSGFCFVNNKPSDPEFFNKKLEAVRKSKYVVIDLTTGKTYKPNDKQVKNIEKFLLIKKSQFKNLKSKAYPDNTAKFQKTSPYKTYTYKNITLYLTDLTSKIKPDRNCSTDVCKEILECINNSKDTIDIAIYGYSSVPEIENAIKNAKKRGVKIRMVYDLDSNGNNIYENTPDMVKIITSNNSDKNSVENSSIMHNKFYIFDNRIIILGSANLSHTDMSGYNTNSVIKADSEDLAKIYKEEFEQMYKGNFHNQKISIKNKTISLPDYKIQVYFSPIDKGIQNGIIPLIRNAKEYIYIPTFLITHNQIVTELISARNRGVDVKIIIDALNASSKHSKHKILRNYGIPVKTENYAGKMHSKSIIIDNKYTIIGSMNFSNSGENRNDENFVIIQNKDISSFYKNFFLYQWDKIDNKWLKADPRSEGKDSVGSCEDGLDNNYDGNIDMEDAACK